MEFTIQKTVIDDLVNIMKIYDHARQFMNSNGNKNQWVDGYPSLAVIIADITCGNSYVCRSNDGEIVGTFCFFVDVEESYAHIYEGKWINDDTYGVVHRLAGSGRMRGIADSCLQWCFEQCRNIRVDTHKDNFVMQHIFKKNGYVRCGTITLKDGSNRIAFQKC